MGTVILPRGGPEVQRIARHEVEANTVALWQLDGDLLDQGPNGLDLTEVGTVPYIPVGALGKVVEQASEPTLTNHGSHPYDAALNIVGELTIEFMLRLNAVDSSSPLITMGVSGSEAENDNYLIFVHLNGSGQLAWLAERNNGENIEGQSQFTATGAVPSLNQWQHITMRRTSGNVITFFIDGVSLGTSGTLLPPTGGTNGVFRIGTSGVSDLEGYLGSVHILDRAKSDTEVLNEANRILPSWQEIL